MRNRSRHAAWLQARALPAVGTVAVMLLRGVANDDRKGRAP
jgi:hypothetical protein